MARRVFFFRSFYCFGIPREYPVVRFDLPSKSMLNGSAGKLDALELTGQPGEDLVFQIAVWAPETALGDLRIDTTDFPLPVRIFLQNANERINLLAGTIQVFWCMVHLPEKETEFTGKFTVSAENEEPQTVTCHLQVSGAVLSDGGESEDFRLARSEVFGGRILFHEAVYLFGYRASTACDGAYRRHKLQIR